MPTTLLAFKSKHRIEPGIVIVQFETQYALAATFLRIQEHYESPRFRNRVFSLEQYMDWYAGRYGAFTYFEDWSGFNVPSTALKPFYAGAFDPLLNKEECLLRLLQDEAAPFYLIGTAARENLKHEAAHALFFLNPTYRREVRAAMRRYDTSGLRQRIAEMGYHRSVLTDEVHAYLIASPAGADLGIARLARLRAQLCAIYRRHAPVLSLT